MPESGPECPPLRTVDLARAAGVHENTVRLYVGWGFLAEPGRGANGYRLWTASHLDQMIFARQAIHGSWPGHRIRESVLALVRRAARGDLEGALADARTHEILVVEEQARAESAAAALDRGRKTGLGKVLNTLCPGEEALTAFDCWLVSLAEQKARAAGLVQMLEARLAKSRQPVSRGLS